jgi:hypothetical protein
MDAAGAGTAAHVFPPSIVRATAAHGPLGQVPVPRTQPSSTDTNVTDAGLSPRSEVGAPAEAEGAGDAEATVAVAVGVAEVTGVATLVDPGPGPPAGRLPPFRVTISAATAMTTTAAAARFTATRAKRRSPRSPARGAGCLDGISPIRVTSSSGAGRAAEARNDARTSRSNDSSLFMA